MTYTRKDQIAVRERYKELLRRDGVIASADKAAEAAGCSETTAKRWLRNEGVLRSRGEASRDVWHEKLSDRWERFVPYLKMGWSCERVAERFDVSPNTVYTAMRRSDEVVQDRERRYHRQYWDPNTRKGRKRQKMVKKMAERRHRGDTLDDIGDEFGYSGRHVSCLLDSPLNPYNNEEYDPDEEYGR